MLKQTRFFISAVLAAVLLVSTLLLSNPNRIEACPAPPPATLLELFLRSDLIVVADVKSEKDGEKVVDETNYYNVEVSRSLSISSVIKGKATRTFVFTRTEYRNKSESNESNENEEDSYYPYGYRGVSKLKSGERYLFFFTKDDETGRLALTDRFSGVKKLNDFELGVHQKRLAELKKIVETKENQLDALTDWLVRLIEEPSTRWDGVADLSSSFQAVEYKDADRETEPFVIDADFNIHVPAIAENLSDAQKDYVSSIYFSSMQNIFDGNDTDDFYYSLTDLVSRWDKSRILTFAYGVLQSVDKTDAEKAGRVMDYISTIVEDEKLSEISSRYEESESENAGEEIAIAESASNTENQAENEIKAAAEENVETIEPSVVRSESAKESASPKKMTAAQRRENALKDFRDRYEYLLARNFVVEEEPDEIAQN